MTYVFHQRALAACLHWKNACTPLLRDMPDIALISQINWPNLMSILTQALQQCVFIFVFLIKWP